jgi:RHS repeat-associated protein
LGANGAVVSSSRYDAWGARTTQGAQDAASFGFTGHLEHKELGLVFTLYRAYDPATGRWLSRDPIGEEGGINLYGYVLNDPINRFDPLGLAWESTPTQGLHYNDRKSGFGFGLGVDDNGRLVPTPLGGKHSFDPTKANQILNDTIADKGKWDELRKQVARDYDNPAFRDKDRCGTLGRAMRRAGVIAGVGALLGTIAATDSAMGAYEKLRDTGQLSDYEKLELIGAVGNSGAPGAGAAAAQLLEILQ